MGPRPPGRGKGLDPGTAGAPALETGFNDGKSVLDRVLSVRQWNFDCCQRFIKCDAVSQILGNHTTGGPTGTFSSSCTFRKPLLEVSAPGPRRVCSLRRGVPCTLSVP